MCHVPFILPPFPFSCSRPVPSDPGRFLGAVSGLAETVGDGGDVLFCRHNRCWRLFVAHNQWRPVSRTLLSPVRGGSSVFIYLFIYL